MDEQTKEARRIEVLNCLIDAWQDMDSPLVGGISYGEAIEHIEAMGGKTPDRLLARIAEFEKMAKEGR